MIGVRVQAVDQLFEPADNTTYAHLISLQSVWLGWKFR